MAIAKGGNTPKKGMNRSSASFEITDSEYTFAFNANFHDEHGTGQVNLQNEPSNVYCSGFKEGYKVIGHKYHLNRDRTYFFLVNPETGCSEIGYIESFQNVDDLEALSTECDCNLTVILEDPLENTSQEAMCTYTTIISDYCALTDSCTGCLDFSVDRPMYESNLVIKDELTGTNLYFTDSQIPRYIQLDNLDIYTQNVDDCTGEITGTCMDCDKLRVFPLNDKICIQPRVIQGGGNLRAGMYEAVAAYCDFNGNELSDYYSKTNLIPIHDPNNNVLDQTDLNYLTNLAIGLSVTDIDKDYSYFKIVVIYKSGLDSSVTVFENGVYSIDTERVTISTTTDKSKLNLADIISRKVIYRTAKGFAEGNGYLFQYGMEAHREINLQPVMNLAGAFVKWNTVQAKEGLYTDGVAVANYLSYMRDEVVPLSIKFFSEGGYETPNFIFIPRPPTAEEIQVLGEAGFDTNPNTDSINEYNPVCAENLRDKRWQYENTAKVEGNCPIPANIENVTVVKTEYLDCAITDANGAVSVITSVASGALTLPSAKPLHEYINENLATVLAEVGAEWSAIQTILNNPGNFPATCDPEFPNNCGSVTETSATMYPIATGAQVDNITYIPYILHTRVHEPSECNVFLEPELFDAAFTNAYMTPDDEVKIRQAFFGNTSQPLAEEATWFTDASTDSAFHLQNEGGSNGLASVQTDHQGYWIGTVGNGAYAGKVHTNALWFTVTFDGATTVDFEISTTDNGGQDDNTGDSLRMTAFDDASTSRIVAYDRVISDLTLVNDPNKHMQLVAADFPSGIATIAIDSSYVEQTFVEITNLDDDSANVTIDGNTYGITWKDNEEDTVTKFVKKRDGAIWNDHAIAIFAVGEVILFQCTPAQALLISVDVGDVTIRDTARVQPPSGCINVFKKETPVTNEITFTGLDFAKNIVYQSDCTYTQPKLRDCEPHPHRYGSFSYWESEILYPCNDELFDSSALEIATTDIPASIKDDFEEYFTAGTDAGNYILNEGTDYRDKPIRHYKFPSNDIIPFMSPYSEGPEAFVESVIYPIGFSIDTEVIRTFLDIAVTNGLISLDERSKLTRYEIFRGDRSVDKSIIAKGLLFDMYQYQETSGDNSYYPNFPLNAMGSDPYNGEVPHRFDSLKNNLFTFHSPDTSFYKPTLPSEIKLEGYQMGSSETYYDVVEDHPTYVILSQKGYSLATSLAVAEVLLEIVVTGFEYFLQASAAGTLPGIPLAIIAASLAVAGLIGGLFKVGKLRYQWIQTFLDLGHPEQFAYYSTTVGHYNKFLMNTVDDSQVRGLATSQYIKEGRWSVVEESTGSHLNINNLDREDSVFLGLGPDEDYALTYPAAYTVYDNSDIDLPSSSTPEYSGTGRSPRLTGNAASPYISLKQYLPSQYGSINSVNWFSTGFCGDIDLVSECQPIFGGDTYISRFAPKRKFPYFTNNAFGLAPLTPYKYSDYFNVNPQSLDRSYLDYLINTAAGDFPIGGFVFPTQKSTYNFFNEVVDDSSVYIKPPAKFLLFSYGFPHFLVESQFNGDYRYAKREPHENFYPNVKDTIAWTQEKNVSIRQPNNYFYNFVYSTIPTRVPWRTLPLDYDRELYDKLGDLSNTIIYSGQDRSENSLTDPWLIYKPLDAYQFPTSYGELIDVDGIESEQMLGRFENGITLFGAIDVLRDRLTTDTQRLGSGGIFSGRNISFNETDLGYAGTQHTAKVSCEFGHFWVDAKRGEVFNLEPNGKGLGQITSGMEEWFKDHLPFKIKKSFPKIPDSELDNAFKGLGITMAWDARSKRVFLTKLDYIPVAGTGVEYINGGFYIPGDAANRNVEVFLQDTEYFTDCSFTIAYSPLTKTWISYYGFKPNYYIEYEGYFQTGINYSADETKLGLWSHLPFLSSYQVFYGELQPFTIEYSLPSKGVNSTVHSINYWLDVRKYYNKYDIADIVGYGYNKAFVYNNYQNSGQLNLVCKNTNDLSQEMNYPKHNSDSVDILQSEIVGEYNFNYLYNTIRNERSGLPVWLNDDNQIHKTLNLPLLDMSPRYKDRLKGDYFSVRLQQDKESRYKMIHRFSTDKRDFR